MKVEICLGTACHIKGSQVIVDYLKAEIEKRNLQDKVELCGKFCMNLCQEQDGVNIHIDGERFSVRAAEVESFFEQNILGRL